MCIRDRLGSLPNDERKKFASDLNSIKDELQEKINSKLQEIEIKEINSKLENEKLDVTLPESVEINERYDERLKLISNFDSTRQIELEERIMDEVNGYRRILFYTNLYDNEGREELLEERIYNSIKDLEVFQNLIKI